MNRLLTLAIPTYNAEKCLPRLLDSLAEQNFSNCNVFVSDDGSTDGTLGLIQTFATEHSGVVSYERHENIGIGATRNLILRKLESQYVWFLDHDDEIRPECLAELVKVLEDVEPEILWMDRVIFSEMPEGWPTVASYEPRQVSREAMMVLMDFPPWRKIYNVALLKNADVKFTRYFGEDVPQTLHAVACAQKLFRVDAAVYRHLPISTAVTLSPASDWMMTTAPETVREIQSLKRKFPQYCSMFDFRTYEFIVWVLKYLREQRERFPEDRKITDCILKFEGEFEGICGTRDNPYIEIARRTKTDLLEQKIKTLSEKIRQIDNAYKNSVSWRVTVPIRWICRTLSGGHA